MPCNLPCRYFYVIHTLRINSCVKLMYHPSMLGRFWPTPCKHGCTACLSGPWCVDRYQSHDGLHNPCLDSFCDGTCVYRVNGSLGQGIQGWYLEGEILLIIASNSRYWFGGQRHTTVGPQFLIVVENSKRMKYSLKYVNWQNYVCY